MEDAVAVLERQLRQGWRWLRFAGALEADFSTRYEQDQIRVRLVLMVTALVLIGSTPLLDRLMLHPPEPFARFSHFLQLGVMIPATLVTLLITLMPRLRRASVAASLVTVAIIAGCVIAQRRAGALVGYHVPPELVSVAIAGTFVLAGLGFWRVLPLALCILGAMAVNEIASYGRTSATLYTLNASVMLALIAGVAGYLQEHQARGTWLRERLLEELTTRDPLTGLLNSRAFEQQYAVRCALAGRQRQPVLVAVLDVDFFKDFNDCYGHAAGDATLAEVARTMQRQLLRDGDVKGRIGGEEFAFACFGLDAALARNLIEDLRQAIQGLGIAHGQSQLRERVLTVSIGATWFLPEAVRDAERAMRTADARLYQAKRAGRNRISFGEGIDEPLPAVVERPQAASA